MAVFRCKMCGGTIEFEQGATVGVCDSCGTMQTLPTTNDEVITNLHNRANTLRLKCEFDKAEQVYNKILEQNPADAEAHWGIILCKYGIEYVEDPKTYKRVPTCHRTSFDPVLTDEDYKAAMENADGAQRNIYETEAKEIDRLQKEILAIVKNEEPFDVFICYKETDFDGKRTQDSVVANDIYHQLTQEGFKVFYAAITLEDKIGQEYEPYIFAALQSAKVMLVVGSKPEYFSAVWVKNEWSRYLKLMKTDRKKLLIPCYKDIDAYELPEEFSHLQAQDMGKIGFINDLIRGIKKVLQAENGTEKTKATAAAEAAPVSAAAPLLERAFMFLEDGDWAKADDFCEQVLNLEPKNAGAYLGKLMAEIKVNTADKLKDAAEPFDGNAQYAKCVRFADDKLKAKLEADNAFIRDRNETARKEGIYKRACADMRSARAEYDYKQAAKTFQSIPGYREADALVNLCLEQAEIARKDDIYRAGKASMQRGNNSITTENDTALRVLQCRNYNKSVTEYENAIIILKSISGWRDADELVAACQRKIEEIQAKREADRIEAERRAEQERIAAELAAKKKKKTLAIVLSSIAVAIAFVIVLFTVIMPTANYNKAIALKNAGQYTEAFAAFEALGDYKDSAEQITAIRKSAAYIKTLSTGDTLLFGAYEQDNNTNNGKEEIEWRVLAKEGDKLLVISEYALDAKPYNTEYTSVTWETCSLRKWLNEDFINTAFGAEEQALIQTTTVTADKNPSYSTNPGNDTEDKIFLLSIEEANKYFTSNEDRKCGTTDYAKAQGASTSSDNKKGGKATGRWWLRSPGIIQFYAARVFNDGSVDGYGCNVRSGSDCVRPALWINLAS